ncbi:MAG TPA: hypothetical protein VM658_00295 [bacterium]|nr:hypothetical protein [bacterium]
MVAEKLRNLAVRGFLGLTLLLVAGGCPRPGPAVSGAPAAVADASSLRAMLQARTAGVARLDANLEVRLAGSAAAYRGRFFGTLRMERRSPEEAALWLQVYSLIGAPVLEVIADGDRVEVYSPLDRTVLFNFTELMGSEDREEFPLTSFGEVAFPLDLLRSELKLLWGFGFDDRYRYELLDTSDAYVLSEWNGDELLREMEYSRPGLGLKRVRVYRGGSPVGGMDCGDYGAEGKGSLFPGRIEAREGESLVTLGLKNMRFDGEATGPAITFRMPAHERLILLTPPVP